MSNDLRQTLAETAPLGQVSPYPKAYDKKLLFPVMRQKQRDAMGFGPEQTFLGADIWNCYELLWLNPKGKPVRASASFVVPAHSPFLAESKSVKLYLNSLNYERFYGEAEVRDTIARDLSALCGAKVEVTINPKSHRELVSKAAGYECLDDLDVEIVTYERKASLLQVSPDFVSNERVYTELFKSHCLCTGQPDLGAIFIDYSGPRIERESLLKYLISYYDHVGFAENCLEQIYVDLMDRARPERLSVFARFTRRGGIDINPYRHSTNTHIRDERLIYQ